jgi:plasmid stabilization system protein ParE
MLYTLKQWGAVQRDLYATTLNDALDRLSQFPELGEARDDLAAGVREWHVAQHVMFYRSTPKTIRLIRIRHVKANSLSPEDF